MRKDTVVHLLKDVRGGDGGTAGIKDMISSVDVASRDLTNYNISRVNLLQVLTRKRETSEDIEQQTTLHPTSITSEQRR